MKEPYKRDCILQKRRFILRSLLIVVSAYVPVSDEEWIRYTQKSPIHPQKSPIYPHMPVLEDTCVVYPMTVLPHMMMIVFITSKSLVSLVWKLFAQILLDSRGEMRIALIITLGEIM